MTGKEKKQPRGRKIGVQWKLFAFLMAFVVFMLAVIWLFQIRLLGFFYEKAKYRELETIGDIIETKLDSNSLDDAVYSCAVDYSLCIRVFRQTETGDFVEAASADVAADCLVHRLKQAELLDIYNQTIEGDGIYIQKKEIASRVGAFWSEKDAKTTKMFEIIGAGDSSISVIYNRLLTGNNGNTYLLMLGSELTPVNATLRTLMRQFWWIIGLLTLGVFLLAFLLSRFISRPIAKMSRDAANLAEGRYDTRFEGKGYREIGELADSLNFASEELGRVDRLQKELIANVSHDLRTPLTMIRGYGEMVRDIPEENNAENMQVIIDETSRLSDLVSDMLDISRIHAGTRVPQKECFDFTGTVREVMSRYDKLCRAEGYEILFESDESVNVFADRTMILQAVYNLINNAVNYAGEDKRVAVRQTVSNDTVRLSVSDNGPGIAPEDISLIWDRYYRADGVHKRTVIGTGLGLSIVKRVLEAHRAKYGVESALGHGATFWFELPVVPVEESI